MNDSQGQQVQVDEDSVIRSLFDKQFAIDHHKSAPMYIQRIAYLDQLVQNGRSRKTLKDTAALLLHVIRVLELHEQQIVSEADIHKAASSWSKELLAHRPRSSQRSALSFYTAANGFLTFHGLKMKSNPLSSCFDPVFFEFRSIVLSRGYQATTVAAIVPPVQSFLFWLSKRKTELLSLSAADVDAYLESGLTSLNWRPRTVIGRCQALRTFLRVAESREWCKAHLSHTIVNPVVKSRDYAVSSPAWADVRRMIQMTGCTSAVDSRARAILLLCSVYGLRSSEVTHLTLDAFDWESGSFALRRAKNGYWQRFPISEELRYALLIYIENHRPATVCRTLFVTLLSPHRPLQNLVPIVHKQMKLANIETKNFGPHSLRHSCATELLRQDTSLEDIAALLGHRDLRSVSIYARNDWRSLRAVANFSLSGLA